MIEAIQAGLTACCLFALAALSVVCVALVCGPAIRQQWAKFRKLGGIDKVLVAVALVAAIAYGGTKPVQNAGADEGIALVAVAVEYDETNDVTAVEVSFTGHNVTTATPVSVRNGDAEQWRELVKIGATVTSDLATNLLAFAVAGNAATNRCWWVGTETPAVVVESEGITITSFVASSKSVHIAWTCDDTNATVFAIQRQRQGTSEWQTVGSTSGNSFDYVGFTVGESWEWRVTSTYTEGDE